MRLCLCNKIGKIDTFHCQDSSLMNLIIINSSMMLQTNRKYTVHARCRCDRCGIDFVSNNVWMAVYYPRRVDRQHMCADCAHRRRMKKQMVAHRLRIYHGIFNPNIDWLKFIFGDKYYHPHNEIKCLDPNYLPDNPAMCQLLIDRLLNCLRQQAELLYIYHHPVLPTKKQLVRLGTGAIFKCKVDEIPHWISFCEYDWCTCINSRYKTWSMTFSTNSAKFWASSFNIKLSNPMNRFLHRVEKRLLLLDLILTDLRIRQGFPVELCQLISQAYVNMHIARNFRHLANRNN